MVMYVYVSLLMDPCNDYTSVVFTVHIWMNHVK